MDVRQREELQETTPLPKAKNVPLQELPHAFSQLSNEDFKNKYNFEKPDKNQPETRQELITTRRGT